jgi:ATP-binding cassette subfamily B protein
MRLKLGIQQFLDQSHLLRRTFRLVWGAARVWTLAWTGLLVLQGLLPVAIVYLTRLLVDGLVAAVAAHGSWAQARPTLLLAVVTAALLVLSETLQGFIEWIKTAQSELIQDHISNLVHERSASLDMAFYESPDYYDRLYRARTDATTRPLALLESGGSLLQNGLTLLGMAVVLVPYGLWLPLVLVASTAPALYVVVKSNRRLHQWWERSTTDRRWCQYHEWAVTSGSAAAEVRLFGLGDYFRSSYKKIRARMRGEHLQLVRDQALVRLVAGTVALLVSGGVMGWMVWQTMRGLLTMGDLVLFYQAFSRGQSLMRSLLGNMGQIYSNTLFLGNLFDFLDQKSEITDPANPLPPPASVKEGILLKNISFKYPGSERYALKDFSLQIPAGSFVAIVGPNGAGKSSLIKLLCRLYDPQEGIVKIDGIDIRELRIDDLRRMITVLFQTPVPYHATAGGNIALGDLGTKPAQFEIEKAACSAGAHDMIMGLPRGYNTLLGKWFADGTELSGGEWQRIALARSFLRQAQIVLLDEPTSSMDSWAESAWLESFRTLVVDKTVVMITHRFTTAMRADMIHVVDGGGIIESGNHDQLLSLGGLYARSWANQTQPSQPIQC